MDTKRDDLWEITILINNIHCASCVSHIQRIFAGHDAAPQCISIDTSTKAVRVLHQRSPYALKLCDWLSRANFEVLKATTSDEKGHVVQELGTQDLGDVLLEAAPDLWRPPIRESTNDAQCLQFPVRTRSNVHLTKCDVCRQEFLALSHGSANSLNEKLVHYKWADLMPHNHEIPHQENYDLSPLEEELSDSMYRKLVSSSLGHTAPDAERSRHEAVLSIGGMTCASCTGGIDRELSGLPYVDSVNVTLMTNSAKVVFGGNENLEYCYTVQPTVELVGFEPPTNYLV
ncbi:hypothetical protein N7G274_003388 [Stereocaulon virgatum]|uniref:HMA domain-containing protein n=1 Tax=Stereocaulon virgatum TaxID=373712 RepID=A0ABR4AKB5_9LECA